MVYVLRNGDRYSLGGAKNFNFIRSILKNQGTSMVRTLNPTAIVDSSGGMAIPTGILAAQTNPASYFSVATDKAPKAGFDTAVTAIYNDHITIAAWLNTIRTTLGLPLITYTGSPGTPGTVTAIAPSLTAVTGTTVCLDYATGKAEIDKILNNQAVLADAITETLAATVSTKFVQEVNQRTNWTPLVLVNKATTATGNTGADANNLSMLNTAVVAVLTAAQNAVATMVAQLTAGLTGITVSNAPLAAVYVGGTQSVSTPSNTL